MLNMRKLNQSGITHLLVILIVVLVVTLVGFAFLRVIHKKNLGPEINTSELSSAHNEFGIKTLKSLASKENYKKNVVISPASLSMALSMLYEGSDGQTKTALGKLLTYQGLSDDKVKKQNQALIKQLNKTDDVDLNIANALWLVNGFTPHKAFSESLSRYYDAEVEEGTVEKINSWVSDKTKEKITDIITQISSDDRLVLTNAVYFNGIWKNAFNESGTYEQNFTDNEGNSTLKSLMHISLKKAEYFEDGTIKAIRLPYGKDNQYEMVVVLPSNIQQFMDGLSATSYKSMFDKFKEREGELALPKFKQSIGFDSVLIDTFTKLGAGVIFSPSADFTKIGDGLSVSQVAHKVYIDVNEKGTEAAAATAVTVGITSAGPIDNDNFSMVVDHPFFFTINKTSTNEPLFMGVINNPVTE